MFPHIRCSFGQLARLGAALGVCLSLFTSAPVSAHEGHDHGDAEKAAVIGTAFPRVFARSDLYEIVGILKDGQWSITIDDARTNAPVTDARLQVTIGDGQAVDATSTGGGAFSVPQKTTLRGSADVIFAVTARTGDDLLVDTFAPPAETPTVLAQSSTVVGSMPAFAVLLLAALLLGAASLALRTRRGSLASVSAFASALCIAGAVIAVVWTPRSNSAVAATPMVSDAPRRLPDGSAFAAKPTQRLLDVRTEATQPTTARPASQLIGRVIADPNRSSIVQSIYGGRILAGETALPRIGQAVSKGDILVQIEPYLPVADRTTISEKEGEIDQLIAVAETKLRRLRPLASGNAVPMAQIYDLETELEGLRTRRETVRTLRADREILRAPTDGIITSTNVVPGQVIQPQDVLVQIADPKGVWIEAFAYGDGAQTAPVEATAMGASGQSFKLAYLGTSRALRQHASVVHFAIPEPPAGLNIGQPVTVLVQSGQPTTGFVFPRDAIVTNSSGENIVWLHVAPERFEPRPVRILPVDAARVLVAAGLNEGDRVVVRGADLINQVR
jgi:membrane fusion protein, heavy metal efflux system